MLSRPRRVVPFALIGLLGMLALVGCQTPPSGSDGAAYTTGEKAIQRGEALAAEARERASPARDRRLLEAAKAFLAGEEPARAEQVLKAIDPGVLEISERARFDLLYADLARADGRYLLARQLLDDEQVGDALDKLPAPLRRRWHRSRAEVFGELGDTRRSLYEYVRLVRLLEEEAAIRQVHDTIWQGLGRLSGKELEKGLMNTSDADLAGWFELARIQRRHRGDIAGQLASINQWLEGNGGHPAALVMPTALQQAAEMGAGVPRRVALLLPASGDFARAAQSVRNGIFAAYYNVMDSGGQLPRVRIYDTESAPAVELYQRAVADGAQLVMGPLQRDKLLELTKLPGLPVPVLGLSYLEAPNPHSNFYHFGLSIRDEAHQIAQRAWIAGHRSALTIVPRTGWGESALDAFRAAWETRGGRVVPVPPYERDPQEYSQILKPALLVDHSEQRAQRLIRTLGKKVAYTPRRRSDIDMVLMIGYPGSGRQIKPTLEFLFAGDLPVYSTSHIYDGTPSPDQDRDLEGVRFTAMPWTLDTGGDSDIGPGEQVAPALRNLFAMGADAYRLHQWLTLLKRLPDTEIRGATGSLSLGEGNRVIRQQPWARFRGGVPRPAPTPGEQAQ